MAGDTGFHSQCRMVEVLLGERARTIGAKKVHKFARIMKQLLKSTCSPDASS